RSRARSAPAMAWAWACSSPSSSSWPMAGGWTPSTATNRSISRPGCLRPPARAEVAAGWRAPPRGDRLRWHGCLPGAANEARERDRRCAHRYPPRQRRAGARGGLGDRPHCPAPALRRNRGRPAAGGGRRRALRALPVRLLRAHRTTAPAGAGSWERLKARACTRRSGRLQERRLQRLDQALATHDLLELGPADRDVALVAADLHLRTVLHGAALGVDAHVHGRLLAAVADGLDLLKLVGPGQQVLAALEQLSAEVGAQAVAQHRDAQAVDDLAQLPDLGPGQELGLVD